MTIEEAMQAIQDILNELDYSAFVRGHRKGYFEGLGDRIFATSSGKQEEERSE